MCFFLFRIVVHQVYVQTTLPAFPLRRQLSSACVQRDLPGRTVKLVGPLCALTKETSSVINNSLLCNDLRKRSQHQTFVDFEHFCSNLLFSADVDECQSNQYNCPPYEACNNTVGSYTCTCVSGMHDSNGNCLPGR